jgi:hypothetical protein
MSAGDQEVGFGRPCSGSHSTCSHIFPNHSFNGQTPEAMFDDKQSLPYTREPGEKCGVRMSSYCLFNCIALFGYVRNGNSFFVR